MRHPPYIPPPLEHHISPIPAPTFFSIQGYYIDVYIYIRYSITFLLLLLLSRRKQQRLTRMEILIAINQPPPLQIFRHRFGGTIKLTSAKCVSDLLCGRIPPSLFSTSLPPPCYSSVSLCLLHALLEPRYTYTTRSLVHGSRVRSNFHRRAEFFYLSLSSLSIFEGGGMYYISPNQRLIFMDSLETDVGEEGRRKEEEEDGNFNWIRLVDRWMDGWNDRDCGSNSRVTNLFFWMEQDFDDTSYLNFLL